MVLSRIVNQSFYRFSCRYRQKVVYLQCELAQKLADRVEKICIAYLNIVYPTKLNICW